VQLERNFLIIEKQIYFGEIYNNYL